MAAISNMSTLFTTGIELSATLIEQTAGKEGFQNKEDLHKSVQVFVMYAEVK